MKFCTLNKFAVLFIGLIGLAGCAGFNANDYPLSFELNAETGTAVMYGIMDETTPRVVRELIQNFPELQSIVLQEVPGSWYSPATLEAGRLIREAGVNTHIPADGLAYSGGVDFFLAGVERSIEEGAMLGVHTWTSNEVPGVNGVVNAANLPRDHSEHRIFLDFYADMGIPEDFYWFTLQAAPPEDVHIMTAEEIDRYGMITSD